MKRLVLILSLFTATACCAQQWDTVITTRVYQSYFNYAKHEPTMVVYELYKGGGRCDRSHFSFKNDTKIPTARSVDYAGSGYDEGHMANAEDFASDCTLDELTFRFYNCVPQTPNLNRGIYKHWETVIRAESQSDSLRVICGNMFGSSTIGPDKIAVPDSCFKVVQSLSTRTVTHVLVFDNTPSASVREESLAELQKTLGYALPIVENRPAASPTSTIVAPEPQPGQCHALTKKGKRFSRMAAPGSLYCRQNQR